MKLRVLTWNILCTGDVDGRRPAIAQTLRERDPDLVLLQEVRAGEGNGNSDAEQLARELGMHCEFAARQDLGVIVGNAIICRAPVGDVEAIPLPAPEGQEEGRLAVLARLETSSGPLLVGSTHLNWHPEATAARQLQVRRLVDVLAARQDGQPVILGGDFNAPPDSGAISLALDRDAPPRLRDSWREAGDGPGYTWSATNPLTIEWGEPDSRIDYILVADGSTATVRVAATRLVGTAPVEGTWPSDHFGVLAELEIEPAR